MNTIIDRLKDTFRRPQPEKDSEATSNEIGATATVVKDNVEGVLDPESAIIAANRANEATLAYLENPNARINPKMIDLRELANKKTAELMALQAKLKAEALKAVAKVENSKLIAANTETIKAASAVNRERFVKAVEATFEAGKIGVKITGKTAFYLMKILIKTAGEIGSAALDGLAAWGEHSDKREISKREKGIY